MLFRSNLRQQGIRVACAVVGLLGVAAGIAWACDTPVYRYAMYRWRPAPYEVYYFHQDEVPEKDAALNAVIDRLVDEGPHQTNVIFIPVKLQDDPELKQIPRDVRENWLKKENPTLPAYMVVSPVGAELFTGSLDKAAVDSMVDSPLRQEVAGLLEKGKAGVLVLLEGPDKETNAAAEKVAGDLVKAVGAGQVQLYSGTTAPPVEVPGADVRPMPKSKPEVALVKLSRDNVKEEWMVRALMAVEPDLYELAGQPMVFPIYGRGRILPPFVGKGITPENLLECVEFMTGACSCTVKEQNPGADLLTRYDWDAAATTMAEMFGSEEGNEERLTDLFPQLIIPASAPKEDLISTSGASEPVAAAGPAAEPGTEASASSATEGPKESAAETPAAAAPQDPAANSPRVASRTSPEAAPAHAGPENDGYLIRIGLGLAVAFVVLLGATFLLLKPR